MNYSGEAALGDLMHILAHFGRCLGLTDLYTLLDLAARAEPSVALLEEVRVDPSFAVVGR